MAYYTIFNLLLSKLNVMKKFIFLLLICLNLAALAQTSNLKKYRITSTLNSSFQYNMFIGRDKNLLQTNIKALGSGLYDFSGLYYVFGIWFYNPNKQPLGIGFIPALKVSKFRFANNYKIENGTFTLDDDPSHHFYENYFTRDGSKLVVKKIFLPLVILFPISKWFNERNRNVGLYIIPFFESYLYGYHKLFFHNDNGKLSKIKTDNNIIRKMINPNNYGVRAGLKIKYFYIFGQYTFENFFKETTNLNVNELNLGIGIDWLSWLLDDIDKDNAKNKHTHTTSL